MAYGLGFPSHRCTHTQIRTFTHKLTHSFVRTTDCQHPQILTCFHEILRTVHGHAYRTASGASGGNLAITVVAEEHRTAASAVAVAATAVFHITRPPKARAWAAVLGEECRKTASASGVAALACIDMTRDLKAGGWAVIVWPMIRCYRCSPQIGLCPRA